MRFLFSILAVLMLAALPLSKPAHALECNQNATISVTAAATTQLVAAVTGRSIRVCNFAITISATGTAKFVRGTGTNCGTGTTDVTAAMAILGNTAVTMAGGEGNVMRITASNALCLTAVTGNVTGYLNYSIF